MGSGVKIMFDAEVERVVRYEVGGKGARDGVRGAAGQGLRLAIVRSSNKQRLCEIESDVLMTGERRG